MPFALSIKKGKIKKKIGMSKEITGEVMLYKHIIWRNFELLFKSLNHSQEIY